VIVKIMQVNAKRILIWTRADLTYSEKLNFKDSIYIYIFQAIIVFLSFYISTQ
jgi:hypothetical protein